MSNPVPQFPVLARIDGETIRHDGQNPDLILFQNEDDNVEIVFTKSDIPRVMQALSRGLQNLKTLNLIEPPNRGLIVSNTGEFATIVQKLNDCEVARVDLTREDALFLIRNLLTYIK
jgi:hypothetical protein